MEHLSYLSYFNIFVIIPITTIGISMVKDYIDVKKHHDSLKKVL
jgi:hypothetical protein